MTLRVSDESGAPVAAVLGVTVRDQAVDARATEKHIGIADRAWLLGDVEPDALEDVEAFLTAGSDADRNVDLLLGTRGWRRFGWRDPSAFIAAICAYGAVAVAGAADSGSSRNRLSFRYHSTAASRRIRSGVSSMWTK